MSVADALRVIANRENLVDLDIALRFLGFRLIPARQPVQSESRDADENYEVLEDLEDLEDLAPPDTDEDRLAYGRRRDADAGGPTWLWGPFHHGAGAGRDAAAGSRLVPYVLESEEILSTEARHERPVLIERPRTARENEQLWMERLMRYIESWDRERIRQLLLRRVPGNRIDVDKVVLLLAEAKPLRRIPMLPRSKVVLPIQLLYDVGLFAGPFGLDLHALLEAMRLASVAELEHLAFRHSIADGCGHGPAWRWQRYRIPVRRASVILISGGYGDGVHDRVREFHRLMAVLHRHRHQASAVWFGNLPSSTAPPRPQHWTIRAR
jgi:hypothetical protein